ncbi:MAG: AI-2E family transporter [Rhodospirillaceae bacterium]|nr:AI-2E family transporter [Rhodospirillaceae bacterium]
MTTPPSGTNIFSVATSLIILAVTVYFLVIGKDVLIPLVLGIFIAYLLVALSHLIERVKVAGRPPPGWLSLTLAIVFFLLFLTAMVQVIAGNVADAVAASPQYQARLEAVLEQVNALLASVVNRKEPLTLTAIMQQLDLSAAAAKFAGALQTVVGNTFEILLYLVFVLLERRSFDLKLSAMFPDQAREKRLREILLEIGRRTEKYVLIKTVISLIIGAITYVTLAAVGVDFAAFLGLLAFLANYIPYLGSAVGIVAPTIVALLQTGEWSLAAVVMGVLAATHALIGNVLEPRMMGRSLNLSPLLMVVALAVWGSIWGVAGMLLSVPLMVMAMITLAQFPKTRPIAVFMSENGEVN